VTFSYSEQQHEYRLDGQKIPSLTGMLSSDGWSNYLRDVPADVLDAKRDWGTGLHQALLQAEYGYDYDPAYQPHAWEWLRVCRRMGWVQKGHPIWENAERPTYYCRDGFAFGFTPDRASPQAVAEIKGTYSPHPGHNLQTALQCLGLGYPRDTPRFTAYFDRKGLRKLIPCDQTINRDGQTLNVGSEAERLIYEYALALEAA
jgi:hypothetical protein